MTIIVKQKNRDKLRHIGEKIFEVDMPEQDRLYHKFFFGF